MSATVLAEVDLAGAVEASRARATGTVVVLVDLANGGNWLGSPEDGGRWATFCEAHGEFVQHTSKTLARDWMPSPEVWCTGCQEARDGEVGS